jgi:hypothetical protein
MFKVIVPETRSYKAVFEILTFKQKKESVCCASNRSVAVR